MGVQITDIPEEDIVFVRFEADVMSKPCLPYFIALDRKTESVGKKITPMGKGILCTPCKHYGLPGNIALRKFSGSQGD